MPELRTLIEAYIFAADAPLTLDRLCLLLEKPRAEVRPVIEQLLADYSGEERGFYLAEVAGGYQFRTATELGPWLRKLSKDRPFRFSQAALEALAIIAYRQPVTRAEVEYLRGVDSGGVIKSLLEKNLLRILGKKDVPGRPLMYGTSRHFLELFGLRELQDLPTLKEFSALEPELAEALPLEPDKEGQTDG
ncbi:condensin subunit ScpB [Malonomonas rubra DSM 5091]|uniref:Condensin subunit ScpB n=1 Tax=Malonomonas rubra DSM 5091 TaxID=1122189 RepID=A0A1M6DM03_MALRU|nr:SMC-Scp complex subunit ScpB [Malonomonas rubra]SHI74161.1 condensin subunit ScpB [Malonomonas rubra DSM 5091]